MRKLTLPWMFFVMVVLLLATFSRTLVADDLGWLKLTNLLKGTPVDEHCPQSCKNCGHEGCIERVPVDDCVRGDKKVYQGSVHHEYVAIPEVRYKWQMAWVTKEVPATYCKPVCKTENIDHGYQAEHWEKCQNGCAELHCKTCEEKHEQLPCNHCETEPGKTTVKLHYWSCVKVPYTVYRQVEKDVCVKQPRCEKTDVCVTRYVCKNCGWFVCGHCLGIGCKHCNGKGCVQGNGEGSDPCSGQRCEHSNLEECGQQGQ